MERVRERLVERRHDPVDDIVGARLDEQLRVIGFQMLRDQSGLGPFVVGAVGEADRERP